MSAKLTSHYSRSAQDARRVAEAFRDSTRGIDGKRLRERVAELAAGELPEGPEGRHSVGYLAAIMEVAAGATDDNRDNARAFAKAFVSKPPEYSRTKAGLAAIQLEAWLIESGGSLYSRFIETVLDGGESNFLAIFEGKLTVADKDKLKLGTGAFVEFEPIAEAGAVNYDSGELLEFSMFDCKAIGKIDKDILPKGVDDEQIPGTTTDVKMTFESLMPQTRADYDRVFEEGGISRAVASYVLGAERVEAARVEDGQLVIEDVNKVRWFSEDGDVWTPDVDSLSEPKDVDEDTEEHGVVELPHGIYEANISTGAVRSFCNTWAVFANPVLVEGETKEATVVSAQGRAWVVHRPLSEALSLVLESAALYVDSPSEGDAFIEAALAAYAAEHGETCVNESEVLQLVTDIAERPTRADRDYEIKRITTQRLSESYGLGDHDAHALCAVVEAAMHSKFPGLTTIVRFHEDVGQVLVRFSNAPFDAGVEERLQARPSFTIAIDPFDSVGRAAAPQVTAVIRADESSDLGWSNVSGPVGDVARHIEAFIEQLELPDHVDEVDDKKDDKKPDKKFDKKSDDGKAKEGQRRNP